MSDWLDAEAHADRALEMFERGRWAEAEAELRQAISMNPDQAEWHFNLGLTLEHAGRERDALGCYERAIELMPDQAEPLVAASVLAIGQAQFQRAVKWLETAIRIEPHFEEAYANKIEAHRRLGAHDEAETTFYMAQQALPEPSAPCLAVMAESLMQRQAYERAEWCLKEALRLEPHMPRLRARLAAVLSLTGKPQRALQLYLRELRDDPGNIETLLEYGELLQEIGRFPEAGEKYRRVLELEPANVDAHFRLGQLAMAAHRFDQAGLEFELVLKLDPQFPTVRGALAEAMLRRGMKDLARRALLEEFANFTSAIDPANRGAPEHDPKSVAAAAAHVANLLLEVDEPAKAAQLFQFALEVQETTDLLRQLALAKFRAGDHDGGAAVSRRVLRLDPNCIRSIHNLALAALQRKRLAIAHGWITRGLAINRHDDGLRRLRIRLWMAALKTRVRALLGLRES